MVKQNTQPKTVTFYPRDIADIQRVAEETNVRGFSAALRIILQQWREAGYGKQTAPASQ